MKPGFGQIMYEKKIFSIDISQERERICIIIYFLDCYRKWFCPGYLDTV